MKSKNPKIQLIENIQKEKERRESAFRIDFYNKNNRYPSRQQRKAWRKENYDKIENELKTDYNNKLQEYIENNKNILSPKN